MRKLNHRSIYLNQVSMDDITDVSSIILKDSNNKITGYVCTACNCIQQGPLHAIRTGNDRIALSCGYMDCEHTLISQLTKTYKYDNKHSRRTDLMRRYHNSIGLHVSIMGQTSSILWVDGELRKVVVNQQL